MTPGEWREIVEWIDDRYPGQWRPEQAVAYYRDLSRYDPVDVWAAIHGLYEQGREFAPKGSEILARTIVEARNSAREAIYRRGLPEPEPASGFSIASYTEKRFGRAMTASEMLEHMHAVKEAST